MIASTEKRFRDIIDSLKAELFDIERNQNIEQEERVSLASSIYSELERTISQRYTVRRNLLICIYSICETTLASICFDFNKKPNKCKMSKRNPQSGNIAQNVKEQKEKYYLGDYLYSINCNYSKEWPDAHIVNSAIRNLRNYLTHSRPDTIKADKIIESLSANHLGDISQQDGKILFNSTESIHIILNLCYGMLIKAEQAAKEKSAKENI